MLRTEKRDKREKTSTRSHGFWFIFFVESFLKRNLMYETFLKVKNATLNDDKISFVSKFMLFLNGHRQKCEMILYDDQRPEE